MTIPVEGVPPFTEDPGSGSGCTLATPRSDLPPRSCDAQRCRTTRMGAPQGYENPLRRIKEVRGTATTAHGRGLHLGVYAEVEQSGSVRVGDPVRRAA